MEGRLLRAQGPLGKAFQNSFIFTITSGTGSHASLPAKQLPNALTTLDPPGRKQQTPNAEKGSRSEQCSILRFRATETSQDPGGGRSSIAMPPLSLAHLTVPLAQLAPSHQSEKKSNWMLVRNDQIKIQHLHKQNKTSGRTTALQPHVPMAPARAPELLSAAAAGRSLELRLVPMQTLVNSFGPLLGRALQFILDRRHSPEGTIGRPIKMEFPFLVSTEEVVFAS